MRVIAGAARGRKIEGVEGAETRPTLDRVKESVFGILQFEIADEPILDLFAGAGGLGIEALSRGASYCVFADKRPDCVKAVRQNVEKLGFAQRASVRQADYAAAITALEREEARFKLVFLDPPYGSDLAEDAARRLIQGGLLLGGATIVIEDEKAVESSQHFNVFDVRKYGSVYISFIKPQGAEGKL